MIQLYNSLTRTVTPFNPIAPPKVSLYVCGVTVYDHCHIGHARAYVVFDLLKRVLMHAGYEVTHIQNFTDIDDKIINRSNQNKQSWQELTTQYIDAYFKDMSALNILPANNYPKATESVPQMIDLIEHLIQSDHAYEINGSVYFRVHSCKNYGQLSNKKLEDLDSGHRVGIEHQKESPLDFILWKPSKEGEPFWPSPWGNGRPGWHTECVAMVNDQLGAHIDIHGGGADLQFPHHENELAQATCAFHTPFANYWIHNGFVTIDDEKMSKSLNNFFTLREVLNEFPPEALRFFLMRIHYRSPLNYSLDTLNDASTQYNKLLSTFDTISEPKSSPEFVTESMPHKQGFWDALYNDLNTSSAIAELFAINKLIHKYGCGTQLLKELGQSIGLFLSATSNSTPDDIQQLAIKRSEAKQAKDYALADQYRDKIQSEGYLIEDTPEGFRIRKKPN